MTGRKGKGGASATSRSCSRRLTPSFTRAMYVFALSPNGEVPRDVELIAWVREDEGLTLVLSQEDAHRAGLRYESAMQWITLRVHSSLDAVGMTAAFSTALAVAGHQRERHRRPAPRPHLRGRRRRRAGGRGAARAVGRYGRSLM